MIKIKKRSLTLYVLFIKHNLYKVWKRIQDCIMILEGSVTEDLSQVQKANCVPHIYKYPVPQEKDDSLTLN